MPNTNTNSVKKQVYIVEFKLNTVDVETEFNMTVKNAEDVEEAIFKAKDAAMTALNLGPFDTMPVIESVRTRGW